MKNTFGNSISVTIFGESHGEGIGAVIDGLAPGIAVDNGFITSQLNKRKPYGDISTKRREDDEFFIQSGVFNGTTTGTPLCILIKNKCADSSSYEATKGIARPGHADYSAHQKYNGFEDYRGGGHQSGRITAALVASGAILLSALSKKGIHIGTHIKKCGGISDRSFTDIQRDIELLNNTDFAVLDQARKEEMIGAILSASKSGDSVGGILETAISGIEAGVGEPWFDSFEGVLSHIIFSIPAVKGIEFGTGFDIADKKGSEANDVFRVESGKIITETNNNGGINGGITNGMPIIFRCAVKPTPSVFKQQSTVDFENMENTFLTLSGSHDPSIVHRARVVVDSVTAIAVSDMLCQKYGTDFMCK